jgi:hypothetical protein
MPMSKRFICRFAVGKDGVRYSAEWRVWTARNKPDLYIAVRSLAGELKATVHAPWPPHERWERHYGFPLEAASVVSKQAKADGGPHKVRWTGCQLAPETTLEYRVTIRHSSLEETGQPIPDNVTLLPVPSAGEYGQVAVILGPRGPTSGYPRERDGESQLVAEGRLADDRRVWVVYVVRPMKATETGPLAQSPQTPPKSYLNPDADLANAELRAVAVCPHNDGSLEFFDLKVHLNKR